MIPVKRKADWVFGKHPELEEFIQKYGGFNVTKLWEHDCDDCCIFLGGISKFDIYYHGGQFPTVVARFGNGGADYLSSDTGFTIINGVAKVPAITKLN